MVPYSLKRDRDAADLRFGTTGNKAGRTVLLSRISLQRPVSVFSAFVGTPEDTISWMEFSGVHRC
jgi:hypothetical protein